MIEFIKYVYGEQVWLQTRQYPCKQHYPRKQYK
jgi:hypothetical protein